MKLIENSIDGDQLQTSISHADLEDNMATCDLETMNGVDQSKKESSSEKANLDKVVKSSKLPNGICNIPVKHNGYLDDACDEDFQLVLESSSEDGGSPVKKIYDDGISAPQIVQEIEDLLGIDANSDLVLLDDSEKEEDILEENPLSSATSQVSEGEIEKKDLVLLDDSEKEEDILEENPLSSAISQVSEGDNEKKDLVLLDDSEKEKKLKENPLSSVTLQVSEGDIEKKDEVIFFSKKENQDNSSESNKSSEEADCDTSSNMNLVYDEVEIGTENMEVSDVEGITECTKHFSQMSDLGVVNDEIKTENSTVNEECNNTIESDIVKELEKNDKPENVTDEESEKTEESQEKSTNSNNRIECTSASVEQNSENQEMSTSQSTNKSDSSIEWVVLDAVESSEDDVNLSEDKLISSAEICRDTNKSSECKIKTENISVGTKNQLENVKSQSPSLISSGTPRKRTASTVEEQVDGKKPKLELEGENESTQECSKVLKRPLEQNEIALKRSRLSETHDIEITKSECLNMMEVIKDGEHEDSKMKKENFEEDLKNDLTNTGNNFNDKNSAIILKEDLNDILSKKEEKSDSDDKIPVEKEEKGDRDNKIPGEKEEKGDTDDNIPDVDSVKSTTCRRNEGLNEVLSEAQTKENKGAIDCESDRKDCLPESECVSSGSCKVASDEPEMSLNSDKLNQDNKDSNTVGTSIGSDDSDVLVIQDNKETNDENKENVEVGSCSKDVLKNETNLKLDSQISVTEEKEKPSNEKEDEIKQNLESVPHLDSNLKDIVVIEEDPKTTDVSNKSTDNSNNATSKIKEIKVKHNGQIKEKLKLSSKSPFEQLNKNMTKQSEQKQMSNLDKAIESVVIKARRHEASTHLPILKKFHKDQLRRLTRSQLEEAVVLKICEAITDRSDIGQMRLRCKSLEQSNELWKKKAAQFEKQNRELEMVLKRFMSETAHLKKDNQNKMVLPIKVTRSVGLQVVLASSVHGSLVTSRNRVNADVAQRDISRTTSMPQPSQKSQPQSAQPKPISEPQRQKTVTPQAQPRRMGRPLKTPQTPAPSSSIVTPTIPQTVKIAQPSQPVATKTIPTPTKDLEVIDLTDKEEKAKGPPSQQTTVGPAIRVAPSTQVCFVQSSSPSTATQPMAYLVQKAVQRQQYLVATSTPSPPRPMGTVSIRQPSAVAVPVFRAGGQIIPVQTNTPVGVRTSNNSVVNAVRPVPRLQPAQISTLKHPAPLPSTPVLAIKPGLKAPPPKPQLKIAKTVNGIMLSWSMTLTKDIADMALYQLYAYQEGMQPPSTNLWKKVGDVKALPLPMACTLTQFIDGHKYHFAVRAVDVHGRPGPFSQPNTILLSK